MTIDVENIKKNIKLLINGIPFNVDDVEFMKPGKGRAIYRLRLRNLRENTTIDSTYHSGDKLEIADVEAKEFQYLYREGDHYIFMDNETYEQHFIDSKVIGNKKTFLKEGIIVTGLIMNGIPFDITLPNFVELKVLESSVTTKTDTVTAQTKNVVVETGATLGVPTFIKEGDILKIDTRTGVYVERVNIKK